LSGFCRDFAAPPSPCGGVGADRGRFRDSDSENIRHRLPTLGENEKDVVHEYFQRFECLGVTAGDDA
jgi:hypothetical protein